MGEGRASLVYLCLEEEEEEEEGTGGSVRSLSPPVSPPGRRAAPPGRAIPGPFLTPNMPLPHFPVPPPPNVHAQTNKQKHTQQLIIEQRNLKIDYFDDDVDVCYNEEDDTYERCDLAKLPTCADDELICFNRTNRRDKFYRDWHPYFYISYSRVLCYPASWEGEGGCSSCSPGRYCRHEKRCIADETIYCCEGEWGSVCGQEDQQEGQRDYGLGLELEADQFT